MSLYHELKRRNVFRVAIAYLALAWLLIEVAGTVFPGFGIPDWAFRFVVIVLALGFIPTLIFSWAYEITPEGVKREKDVVRDGSITHLTARRLEGITIGLIVVALVFILADRFWLSPGLTEQSAVPAVAVTEQVSTEPETSVEPDRSIAVLPFVNMSDDASNEYFSDGISEELLNLLAKIPELRVISRSSAFSFKGKNSKIADVARDLNVAHVLEGSVRKAGNAVRITAQLIDARSDKHLWSQTYDRELDDIFAIQDEIATAVVDALKLTLLGEVPQAENIDPEAYALYLQAMYLGAQGTNESSKKSNAMLKQVLAIAPDFARAWRILSRNYNNQVNRSLLPRDEGLALSHEALIQALTIDPNFAEAHSSLGYKAMVYDGDLAAAARHFEHALSLEPTNLVVLGNASGLLAKLGRMDEQIAIREFVVAHDPLDPIDHNNLAASYLDAERADDVIATVNTLLMLSPDRLLAHYYLSLALLQKGENEAALEAIQQEPDEESRLEGLVMAYYALGRMAESDVALAEFIEKYEKKVPSYIAAVLAYRGEANLAFAWLEKAVQYKLHGSITTEPRFSSIHDDPRWLPLLESIGRSPDQLAAIEFKIELPDQR
jgi:TolB-like protein/Flp pilus assembly protein TadD